MKNKKYDLNILPDKFTVEDFMKTFNVDKRYLANKTIKYWLSKGYIDQQDDVFVKKNHSENTQEIEQVQQNTEHSTSDKEVTQQSNQDVKSKTNQSNHTKLYEVTVVGNNILSIKAKSFDEVIRIVERQGFSQDKIIKVTELV